MLVIRRRAGECLVIGGDIEIEVLETAGSQVKLGIRAPRTVPVARKELLLIGEQNRAASIPAAPEAVDRLLSDFLLTGSRTPTPRR
jgi:carbon storage regulator